jgi:hypothetical protein
MIEEAHFISGVVDREIHVFWSDLQYLEEPEPKQNVHSNVPIGI